MTQKTNIPTAKSLYFSEPLAPFSSLFPDADIY